jgi:NADH-quinone oxidoreductase subunit H
MTLFTIVFERKVVARMQQRSGPNRTGPAAGASRWPTG